MSAHQPSYAGRGHPNTEHHTARGTGFVTREFNKELFIKMISAL